MDYLRDFLMSISIRDILDIGIVAFILYKCLMLIKETRAEQLLKGILIFLAFTQISKLLHLYTLYWILDKIMGYGVFALFIVFQDELRKGLERMGRTKFFKDEKNVTEEERTVNQLCEAIEELSDKKTGALILIERDTGLNEIASTGVRIDGAVSAGLIVNIFEPNTPLHDGAMIIKSNRIKAAGCFLPLSDDYTIKKTLGTRHRAAIGISERSDCYALVVSEETGMISIAIDGKLKRPLTVLQVKKILLSDINQEGRKDSIFPFRRRKQ